MPFSFLSDSESIIFVSILDSLALSAKQNVYMTLYILLWSKNQGK